MDEPSTPALRRRLDSLGIELAEGQRAEVNLAMDSWLREASQALKKGYVVTIDYGREAAELYSHERFRGTLTTFYRHTQTDNPYVRIGRQDMTSQVDFTTLKRLGEGYGLTNLGYLTQGRFLSNLGLRRWIARLPALGLTQPQRDANRMGMLQLIRPGGMGDFKVLVQARASRMPAVGPSTLSGVGRSGATTGPAAADGPPRAAAPGAVSLLRHGRNGLRPLLNSDHRSPKV